MRVKENSVKFGSDTIDFLRQYFPENIVDGMEKALEKEGKEYFFYLLDIVSLIDKLKMSQQTGEAIPLQSIYTPGDCPLVLDYYSIMTASYLSMEFAKLLGIKLSKKEIEMIKKNRAGASNVFDSDGNFVPELKISEKDQ